MCILEDIVKVKLCLDLCKCRLGVNILVTLCYHSMECNVNTSD